MNKPNEIEIIKGNVSLNKNTETAFLLENGKNIQYKLNFRSAYTIDGEKNITDCIFRVNGRYMKDLSFVEGQSLHTFEEHQEIRLGSDGVKFLYFYEDIPTFDSSDRMWDGNGYTVIYKDSEGVNLLYCRCGYNIPRIDVYIGLTDSDPDISDMLDKL